MGNSLESVFYVGKGSKSRWKEHFLETRSKMKREGAGEELAYTPKQLVIRALYLSSRNLELDIEQQAYFIARNLEPQQAFMIESVLIKMLRELGLGLTNEYPGHHQSGFLVPVGEVRRFLEIEYRKVEVVSSEDLENYLPGWAKQDRSLVILVKGSTEDKDLLEDRVSDERGRFEGAVFADAVGTGEQRRGWNPKRPWSDEEARERARHYWPVAPPVAETLYEIAQDGRVRLALGIFNEQEGVTVIRYSWAIEPDGQWLDYAPRIGIPLGNAFDEGEDPWLGSCLINKQNGRQPLNASGICYIDAGENC